jgi:hypothetical protein
MSILSALLRPFTYASDVQVYLVGTDGALLVGSDGAYLVALPPMESWRKKFLSLGASAKPVMTRYDQ